MYQGKRLYCFLIIGLAMLIFFLGAAGCQQGDEDDVNAANLQEEVPLDRPTEMTAVEAVELLREGNMRFTEGQSAVKDLGSNRRKMLVEEGQKPFAIVVGCSDSRVPPEVIFDWALGDLFVIRTAGNVVDHIALGSIEYGVEHLGVPLIVVLGHDSCGAVKATLEAVETKARLNPNIGAIVERVLKSVDSLDSGSGVLPGVEEVIDENIRAVADELVSRSELIRDKVADDSVTIVGAKYFMESGEVLFFN